MSPGDVQLQALPTELVFAICRHIWSTEPPDLGFTAQNLYRATTISLLNLSFTCRYFRTVVRDSGYLAKVLKLRSGELLGSRLEALEAKEIGYRRHIEQLIIKNESPRLNDFAREATDLTGVRYLNISNQLNLNGLLEASAGSLPLVQHLELQQLPLEQLGSVSTWSFIKRFQYLAVLDLGDAQYRDVDDEPALPGLPDSGVCFPTVRSFNLRYGVLKVAASHLKRLLEHFQNLQEFSCQACLEFSLDIWAAILRPHHLSLKHISLKMDDECQHPGHGLIIEDNLDIAPWSINKFTTLAKLTVAWNWLVSFREIHYPIIEPWTGVMDPWTVVAGIPACTLLEISIPLHIFGFQYLSMWAGRMLHDLGGHMMAQCNAVKISIAEPRSVQFLTIWPQESQVEPSNKQKAYDWVNQLQHEQSKLPEMAVSRPRQTWHIFSFLQGKFAACQVHLELPEDLDEIKNRYFLDFERLKAILRILIDIEGEGWEVALKDVESGYDTWKTYSTFLKSHE